MLPIVIFFEGTSRTLTLCPCAKKKAILDYAWPFARRKSSARSFSLFIPRLVLRLCVGLFAWDKKGSG